MDGYLLDTPVASAYLDPTHEKHKSVIEFIQEKSSKDFTYISVVALAEMTTGAEFFEAFTDMQVPAFRERLISARQHPLLDVTHHTATAYGELKRAVAQRWMPKAMKEKAKRPRFVEDWIDETTGKKLGVDENDLWMCAQVKERGIIFITKDKKMVNRIGAADTSLRFELLED